MLLSAILAKYNGKQNWFKKYSLYFILIFLIILKYVLSINYNEQKLPMTIQ